MDRVARQTKPIKLEIGGIGCIPKWAKPREVCSLPFQTMCILVIFLFSSETNPLGWQVFAGLTTGRDEVKSMIKLLEAELAEARFAINEPGAVRHRTKVPLGVWEDVYVTNLQGDLAKEVSDSLGQYTQASFEGTPERGT